MNDPVMFSVNISLFMSSIRPTLWPHFCTSLRGTSVNYEIIAAGHINTKQYIFPNNFKYIETGYIKPAQCYELARRECTGETVSWVADDCEFPNDVMGKAYKYWKSQNNKKLILSIQTKESGYEVPELTLFNMDTHRFFGGKKNTELMAPICLMGREFLEELGGFDKRFICGQYENFCVKMAYEKGAKVEIFGDENCCVEIDHLAKSIMINEATDKLSFRKRPFARGWEHDRKVLEDSWTTYNMHIHLRLLSYVWNFLSPQKKLSPNWYKKVSPKLLDKFQPYSKNLSKIVSEGPKGDWG